jgi:flagellar basal body rod protein FlgG
MTSSGVARAVESVEQRAEDLRSIYTSGAQPNFSDAIRQEGSEPARDALSIALPPDAYLVAGDPNKPAFTRDGALSVRDGVLVDGSGTSVLGFPAGNSSGVPRELRIDKNDALLERAQDVRIEPDGVFGYARTIVDPKTLQAHVERVVVGHIALARFPAGTRLERVDGTHARPAANVVPFLGTPNDGHFSAVFPQRRAIGRLDADTAIARLQDAYLALRALGALERTKNGVIRGALDLVK